MSPDGDRVALGRIGKAHGVAGAFRVWPYADDLARFERIREVILACGEKVLRAKVESVRMANGYVIVQTAQINRPEDVRAWLGGDLEIKASERVEPESGRFFHDQIIGLKVVTTGGAAVGTITRIIEGPANDVYVCSAGEREYLIPAVDIFIASIDVAAGRMVVAPIPGMLDEPED